VTETIRIGTAGWSIPRRFAALFPESGSGLERYATRLNSAEINSTFYRPHKPQTYARWVAAVPADFRFAVKMPKAVTHERRLVDVEASVDAFVEEAKNLGAKLGPMLIQLPPSLAFDVAVVEPFLKLLRSRTDGDLVFEPRHASWFDGYPDRLLLDYRIARAAADPSRAPQAAVRGGWQGLAYYRLHGSPRLYYSDYSAAFITDLAARLRSAPADRSWCIFDNTVSGAAMGNALDLAAQLQI
jgi:uncharacterized protein YecE (DUF72 family)